LRLLTFTLRFLTRQRPPIGLRVAQLELSIPQRIGYNHVNEMEGTEVQ